MQTSDIPEYFLEAGLKPNRFYVSMLKVFDLYTSSPGAELIVVHQYGTSSVCALRVYASDGEVLNEYWHDGNILDALWVSGTGELLLTALNAEPNTLSLSSIGSRNHHHPFGLLAIAPGLDDPRDVCLSAHVAEPTAPLRWYRLFQPIDARGQFGRIAIEPPLPGDPTGSFARIALNAAGAPASVSFLIDTTGRKIAGSERPTTAYFSHSLPNPADLELEPVEKR